MAAKQNTPTLVRGVLQKLKVRIGQSGNLNMEEAYGSNLSAKDIKHKEYIDDNAVSVSCVSVQLVPRYCFYLRHPFLLKRVRGHLFRIV